MKYLKNINLNIKKYKLYEYSYNFYNELEIDGNDVDEYFEDNYEVDLSIYGVDFLRNFIVTNRLDDDMEYDYIQNEEVEYFSDLRDYIERYESNFIDAVTEKIKDDYEDDYEEDMDFLDMLDLLDNSDFAELINDDDPEEFLKYKWNEYYNGSGMEYLENIYGSDIPKDVIENYIDKDEAKQAIINDEEYEYKKEFFVDNALSEDEWLKKVVDYDNNNALKLFDEFDLTADYFNTYEFQYLVLKLKIYDETMYDIDEMNKEELKEFEKDYKEELIDIVDDIDSNLEFDLNITNKFPSIYRKMKIKRQTKKFKI